MLDVADRLGRAAREHLAIELRPRDQLLGRCAEGLKPAQAEGKRGGHVLGARARPFGGLRQAQARLEIGEPRRHPQIIGGKLHAQLPRRLDKREILVGERENGNLGQVDLLLAREDQQQVERPLEALHVDDERRLVGGALRRDFGIEAELLFAHERTASARTGAIIAAKRRRASASSISGALRRQASAADARRAAAPSSGGTASATSHISSNRPLQWSTTSQPAASAARLRARMVPLSASMEMSSVISTPSNPISPRITSRTIVTEVVAGVAGSMAVKTTWAVIASGTPASRRKARKSVASRLARSASTTGSSRWLSAMARPCPGLCLTTGSTPPSRRPSATAPANTATLSALVPKARLPITASAPATGTSASGQQSTSMPTAAKSAAIRRAPSRAAPSPSSGSRS